MIDIEVGQTDSNGNLLCRDMTTQATVSETPGAGGDGASPGITDSDGNILMKAYATSD